MNDHTAFRSLIYEEMERLQAMLDRYFTEDLGEEDDEEEKPL